jgi:hypothetical protein
MPDITVLSAWIMKKEGKIRDRSNGFYLNVRACDTHAKAVLITPLF